MLAVNRLSKKFGGVVAIDDFSFEVEEGAIHALIGPNGAGKTTILNIISGIYKPDAGSISLQGKEITGIAPEFLARRGLSRTFQNLQIIGDMTALENVMIGAHLQLNSKISSAVLGLPSLKRRDEECRETSLDLIKFVGVEKYADALAANLPFGIQKRLEIARALAAKPGILLLDEPAAGLNPAETEALGKLIQSVNASGVTVLLVEHDMKLVMGVSHKISVLNFGRKLAEGSPESVRTHPAVIDAYLGAAV